MTSPDSDHGLVCVTRTRATRPRHSSGLAKKTSWFPPERPRHFPLLSASTNTSTAGAQANATNLGIAPGNYSSFFLGLLGTSGAGDAITVATISGINATNFYRVDNVIVAAVPEPSSLMLAGFAGVMCLARRRTRR